ncbi:MAG: DUF389 domain-containing protein [Calditrichaeota bacterium]|nr:DUF389 domain-containing protein [Candidatus Cloacimonadota bacterium]MCB1046363.1 DUF389 domain-containing protein [Calditrichota bacterium]MCB9474311.1 DUF389 domain-containing protein [Candidatus Delongbacteria bacterium]
MMENTSASSGLLSTIGSSMRALMQQLFSLKPDTDYDGTLQRVRADIDFRGGNIWALVFAILIASVGLNVNSTAVVIGAMLISPLMGPIVGTGFGLATNDFPLLRRSARNLLLATGVALVASTLYFLISPLEDAQSELLARTRPTLYDVMIALFGGGAGVVAVTRKAMKGNVVPGVAIATALMPPLCTAGYGLAQGNLWFFLGAMHLFLINALFICLATLGFVRLMYFERVAELDKEHVTRARFLIVLMTFAIAVPSAFTGWRVIQEARFQQVARRYISENLAFNDRAILNVDLKYSRNGSTITATLLGQPLPPEVKTMLEERLRTYGLEGTQLVLNQPVDGQANVEQLSQMVRQGILEDLYQRNDAALSAREEQIRVLEDEVVRLRSTQFPVGELSKELAALYPDLVSIGVGHEKKVHDVVPDSLLSLVVMAQWTKMPGREEQNRLRDFLMLRLKVDGLSLFNSKVD